MTEKYKGTYQVQSLESDMETREKAKQEGMSTGSYIRRNEKKTEEKQPEKQTDGNETDQKIPKQTLIKASSRTQTSRRLMKRQLLMKKRQQRSRETMKQRPVRKKRSRTVRTAISKPKKMQLPDQRKTHRRNKMGKQSSPQHKILRKTEMTKSLSKSITIITGIMIAMNIGNSIGIMKIHQTEGIRTATGTERRMPINIKIRREVPANKLHY